MMEDTMPPTRVVAGLTHNPNVRKGEIRDGTVKLHLTNSGIGHTVLQHLRFMGYEVVSISPRFKTVRCVPVGKPTVAPKDQSRSIEFHRGRLLSDGGRNASSTGGQDDA